MTMDTSHLVALAGSIILPIVSLQIAFQVRTENRITRMETLVEERDKEQDRRHDEHRRRFERLESRA